MKTALTFLTISVVLLLGSTMWGMKTYTDLAHALSDVADLKQELERYRSGAATNNGSYQVGMPSTVAQTQPQTQPQLPAPAQPTLDEAEIEARLEEMIAERMSQAAEPPSTTRAPQRSSMEQELQMLERESSAIDRERQSLLAEREDALTEPLLTEGQNRIASAPILASVTEANTQYSFIVMDAGENKNLSEGDVYSIRRNHMIIGEAKIDSVEPSVAVATVKSSTIPTGIVIKKGDHVIEYVGPSGS